MKTYIALLRGINVGGRNSLPMKALTALLEDLGCMNIKTYIQSGNVVFHSPKESAAQSPKAISTEIKKRHNFEPRVLILEVKDLQRAIAMNPFPDAESDPKSLHVSFLDTPPPDPDLNKLESLKTASEQFQLIGRVFYLHAPDGVGRSKLAANAEKFIGVSMTGRNWRTVAKIAEMVKELN